MYAGVVEAWVAWARVQADVQCDRGAHATHAIRPVMALHANSDAWQPSVSKCHRSDKQVVALKNGIMYRAVQQKRPPYRSKVWQAFSEHHCFAIQRERRFGEWRRRHGNKKQYR